LAGAFSGFGLRGCGGVASIRFSVSLNLASSSLGSDMINPAFINFPEEASLLGAMVIGYGELDLSFAHMAGLAIGQTYAVLDACHVIRSESGRLDIANALAVNSFRQMKLGEEYEYSHKAVRFCLKLRNQHAHSQWGEIEGRLMFSSAEGAFRQPLQPIRWNLITLDLLKKQEAYFEHTRKCLLTLITLLEARGKTRFVPLLMPEEMHQPHMQSQMPKRTHARKGPEPEPRP
jgi:hypothetical protein